MFPRSDLLPSEEQGKLCCGLQEAMDKGEVKTSEHKGIKMYYFPRVRLGQEETAEDIQKVHRTKTTTTKDFAELSDFMRTMGWNIDSKSMAASSKDRH